MDVISQEGIITYESLVQEATREYRDLVDSKRWELATSKENYQYQPSLPKACTVVVEHSINKSLSRLISIAAAVEMVVSLEEGHLPGQI